jgi:glycerol-3-phosphate acyltransferase PlsY
MIGKLAAALAAAYLLGAFPTGYLLVRLRTGRDIRDENSGRVGGTNVMRSTGFAVGLTTAFADMAKSWLAVALARWLLPGLPLVHVCAGLLAIIGHNYNLLLIRRQGGRWRLNGGAGGAPTVGAAVGLWAPAGLVIVPLAALVLILTGYASIATMSVGLLALGILALRAWLGAGPWSYAWFGVGSEVLLLWSLRPNIRRLLAGHERMVGPRAGRREAKLRAGKRIGSWSTDGD